MNIMDEKYMKLAIKLAKKGKGQVNPNPLVGALIVKNGKIIGQGYHENYGSAHAEVNALNSVSESPEGGTIYVTLEPCSHYGKTPPCVDRIIESRLSRVVIGSLDPNHLVAGKGVGKLKAAGIEVTIGVLDKKCKKINEVFRKFIVEKKPYVLLKTAMTLDGKIATATGESKWITGEAARNNVHKLRNEFSAIMVGVETVIKDNPQLTCRVEGGRNPIRIVVDSILRIPLTSKVVTEVKEARTIVATTAAADIEKCEELRKLGVEIIVVKGNDRRVDLTDLIGKLGAMNIDGVLLEGGATLGFSALKEGIVDKVQFYIAPKIIGGHLSKTPVGGEGISNLSEAIKIKNMTTTVVGNDILVEGYVRKGGRGIVYRDS